jgi:hypothetical protein
MATGNLLGVKPEVIIASGAKRQLVILPIVSTNQQFKPTGSLISVWLRDIPDIATPLFWGV